MTEPASWRYLWDELDDDAHAALIGAAYEERARVRPELAQAIERASERVRERGLSLPEARAVLLGRSGDDVTYHVRMPLLEWVSRRFPPPTD